MEGLSWTEAAAMCSQQSPFFGRLCTVQELETGCVRGDGCDFDKAMLWSCNAESGNVDLDNDAALCPLVDCGGCYDKGASWAEYADARVDMLGLNMSEALVVLGGRGAAGKATALLLRDLTQEGIFRRCCDGEPRTCKHNRTMLILSTALMGPAVLASCLFGAEGRRRANSARAAQRATRMRRPRKVHVAAAQKARGSFE